MKILNRLTEWGLVAGILSVTLLAACGGGRESTTGTGGFSQSYTTSAGVGEVLQFSINTTSLTYSYSVTKTSYAASGVTAGQSGTGTLNNNGDGTFAVSASSDSFIQSGKVRPIRNALFVGHVLINSIGGANKIPVFGLSNPITSVATLADTYNFQGFSCNVRGIADVTGNASCASHYGTGTIDTSGNYSICLSGNISDTANHPCTATTSGTIQAINGLSGVFDYWNTTTGHIGWLFAYTAANGQKVAVIDHDDAVSVTHEFGHSVFTSYASVTSGAIDGKYFVKSNEGGEHLVTISGSSVAFTLYPGVNGTLTYNSPWNGLLSYQVPAWGAAAGASGVAMATGSGAYTNISNDDSAIFTVGFKYQ